MDISNIYDHFILKEESLEKNGFIKEKDGYMLSKTIMNDTMKVTFKITKEKITVDVYDLETNELYLPFNFVNNSGKYVNQVKDEVSIHLGEILDHCFIKNNLKERLNQYVWTKYHLEPEYPWGDEDFVYKVNDKWFGIVMNVKYKSLGITKEGKVDIINVKLNSEKIKELIDNQSFFPAYHMNKDHWITILLSAKLQIETIEKYLDQSYNLVKK